MGSSTLKIVGFFIAFIALISLTTFSLFNSNDAGANGLSKSDVEAIVKEYIENNPEVIIDSLNNYQRKAESDRHNDSQSAAKENKELLENDPTSPVAGNVNGDVTIVEFFDYSCGYCKKVQPDVIKLLEEDKNLKVVFKEFPILGNNSTIAAKAAIATHLIQPDKYIDIHNELMEKRISGQEAVLNAAAALGIDKAKLSEKMESDEVQQIIDKNRELAGIVGVRGTPAFTINGQFIPGAIGYNQFKEIIAQARRDKETM